MTNNNVNYVTGELVKDFVCYRLKKAGYDNFGSVATTNTPESVTRRTLRLMGDEFTNAYFNAFDDMTSSINIHDENLRDVLCNILDVTCETGIHWGRIIGVFVFSSVLAVKAMDCQREDVVENIIQWTVDYLGTPRFSNWIVQHGGWVSIIIYQI